MMGWGDAGFGFMGVIWFMAMAAFWVLIGIGAVLVIRALLGGGKQATASPPASTPPTGFQQPSAPVSPRSDTLRILEERYARGEIDRDEFLQRKVDLLS